MSAGDYWLFRSENAQNRSPETGGQFPKARHSTSIRDSFSKLASLGHAARLMPAKYVRPYSKGQKNDFNMPKRLPKPCSARR